ncbi:MAG: FAD-dependent oxidoreductase [Deltaproteobacteria bacterium]|nr:FAD-dependent oxidoreductase [Deltaproteobacteria bacterium]
MASGSTQLKGPDLAAGVKLSDVPDGGVLRARVGDEPVLVFRRGEEVSAVGATCTHYGGPLAEGLVDGEQVGCPWHHACFDLRTGEALRAPALDPLPCWNVERRGDLVRARPREPRHVLSGKRTPTPRASNATGSVLIVGAGAAGGVLAGELRKLGHAGAITLLGEEPPVDRPNLSKDYLAGNAPEDWIPLRPSEYWAEQRIELRLSTRASAIDLAGKAVSLASGERLAFDALVLATGAEPIRLDLPGAERALTLRSFADSRAIIDAAGAGGAGDAAGAGGAGDAAERSRRAVVVGASFIGLEVAASLRARELEVDVVAPDAAPLARVLGPELGAFVRRLHEEHGVRFHLGRRPRSIEPTSVTLDDGTTLAADLVVAGVGVRPRTELAENAGLRCDRGVLVDERLETSHPGVFAIGDVARYPDAVAGEHVRIEHWVVAERQAQSVARTLVGRPEPYRDVPFFWSRHYDVSIAYVGHATSWDRVRIKGSIEGKDCLVGYERAGRIVALASIFRDRESLEAEAALRRRDFAAVARLFD